MNKNRLGYRDNIFPQSLLPLLIIWLPLSLAIAEENVPTARNQAERESQRAANTWTNSLGMRFVTIPQGTFLMGSTEADADSREKPAHSVTLSKAFYIGQFEVTQKDWEEVMGEAPYSRDRSNPFYQLPGMAKRITRPNHPATVSWQDAQAFISKLNQREGTNRYRLPTEAEWEYVARAGTTGRYFFGDDPARLADYAWYGENFATGGTHPVGKKQPNPWGVNDIYGNTWEWVNDYYSTDYYAQSPPVDPQGPSQGSQRVVRGGSWHSTADGWHSAWRKPYPEDYRGISIGFRLVREKE
ncbi:formylglycine-generating enzyme family protein [Chania multitudinisentens]|uniref:formylglycine-generating enzyme family protein n=1 Tax=Chania multitudinisentens TaxID=1639108 RepID=UPI0003E13581|nr:formylglycine-generating enzyme family protein [Chania multitudinisentens]